MAEKASRPESIHRDNGNDEGDQPSSPLLNNPRTLSFIKNVPTAVAQIEERLANSPSAHPPPPNRRELPETPPGPTDSVFERVQFLESSLALSPPVRSISTSLDQSTIGEAIHPASPSFANHVIVSTTTSNNLNSNLINPINILSKSQTADHLPVAPIVKAIDVEMKASSPPIAPLVAQFETAVTPIFQKEHDPQISASEIAPIVEQFDMPSSTAENSNESVVPERLSETIIPVVHSLETIESPKGATCSGPTMATDEESSQPPTEISGPSPDDHVILPKTTSPTVSSSEQLENKRCADKPLKPFDETKVITETSIAVEIASVAKLAKAQNEQTLRTDSSTCTETQTTPRVAEQVEPVLIVNGFEHTMDDLKEVRSKPGNTDDVEMFRDQTTEDVNQIDGFGNSGSTSSIKGDQKCSMNGQEGNNVMEHSHEGAAVVQKGYVLMDSGNGKSACRVTEEADATNGQTFAVAEASSDFPAIPHESHERLSSQEGRNTEDYEHSISATPREVSTNDNACMASSQPDGQWPSVGRSSPADPGSSTIETPPVSAVTSEPIDASPGAVERPRDGALGTPHEILTMTDVRTNAAEHTGPSEPIVSGLKDGKGRSRSQSAATQGRIAVEKDGVTTTDCNATSPNPAFKEHVSNPDVPITQDGISQTTSSYEAQAVSARGISPTSSPTEAAPSDMSSNLPEEVQGLGPVQPDGYGSGMSFVSPGLPSLSTPQEMHSSAVDANSLSNTLKGTHQARGTNGREPQQQSLDEDHLEAPERYQLSEVETVTDASIAQGNPSVTEGDTASTRTREVSRPIRNEFNGTSKQNVLETMAAKATFAREKLAKSSPTKSAPGTPVKSPQQDTIVGLARSGDSPAKETLITPSHRKPPLSPNFDQKSQSRRAQRTKSSTPSASCTENITTEIPTQSELRLPPTSSPGSDNISLNFPPTRIFPKQAGKASSPQSKISTDQSRSECKHVDVGLHSESQLSMQISQRSPEGSSRLPRVASLSSARNVSSTKPESAAGFQARKKLPRAKTMSTMGLRSTSAHSSPMINPKKGIASSLPVTPSGVKTGHGLPHPPLRRTLSFTHPRSNHGSASISPMSRISYCRSHGDSEMTSSPGHNDSDAHSTVSLPVSGLRPPRANRPRFTVPEPFALLSPEAHAKYVKMMGEERRKAAEAEAKPRIFKPRPMPDFSRPPSKTRGSS